MLVVVGHGGEGDEKHRKKRGTKPLEHAPVRAHKSASIFFRERDSSSFFKVPFTRTGEKTRAARRGGADYVLL